MHLFSLDKKRLIVQHKLDTRQLENIKLQHGMTKEQIQEQIQRELYQKFMQGIYKFIPTKLTPNPETGEELYTIEGYVLSQLALMELMQELLDMDEAERKKMLDEVNHAIKYRPNKMK